MRLYQLSHLEQVEQLIAFLQKSLKFVRENSSGGAIVNHPLAVTFDAQTKALLKITEHPGVEQNTDRRFIIAP